MTDTSARLVLIGIVVGVVAGGLAGWFGGERMLAVAWIGELFLNALKMLIVPLIVAAVVSGVSALGDVRKLGRLGGLTVAYYVSTTAVAAAIGLAMVNLIQPGTGIELGVLAAGETPVAPPDASWQDLVKSLVSPNLVASAADTQLLPLIVFSILLSAALSTLGATGAHVIAFFNGIHEAMMKLVTWLMFVAPLGIFALVAARLGQAGGGDEVLRDLRAVGLHCLTVLSGLAIHFAVLTAVLAVLGRRGLGYLAAMARAVLTSFGTASSSATLPLTMECAREAGVDRRAVRFVLPLGSTVNMDGTALYEAAAALFIAQAYGVELGPAQQGIVFVTATLAAIGAAGIPEAGLVTMAIVLSAVGLPLEGIGLLLTVDWFLDRFRTAVNVWGDAVGAAVVQRFLPPLQAE